MRCWKMRPCLSDESFGLQWMVLIIFLSDFSPRMTGSRMSFSLPPKLTKLHIRTPPPTLGPGTLRRRWWAASCFFSLALAVIWLRTTPGMWLWFSNAPCPVCVCDLNSTACHTCGWSGASLENSSSGCYCQGSMPAQVVHCLDPWSLLLPEIYCSWKGHNMVRCWFVFQPNWSRVCSRASDPSKIFTAYEIRCRGLGNRERIYMMEI